MILHKHITGMTLEEKCAQVVMADYRFDDPDPERAVRLAKAGIGGFCFFFGSIFEIPPLVNSLQNLARFPLLFSSDYENGVGHQVSGATLFPTNLAVGATDSEELARLKGRLTAIEAVTLGVPWVLGPVVDLQSNPKNPIINTRAFGASHEKVTRLARAFAQGVREGRGLTCAKHFPGHGDVTTDSHLELPSLERAESVLRDEDLRPFIELKDEVDSIMTAHLDVPSLDPDRPASLSPKITEDLLRKDIGFPGLIATDALMMGGITKVVPEPEALVMAVEAGANALFYPVEPEAAPGILMKAVRDGRLSEERLEQAVEHIFGLKERAGLFQNRHVDPNRIESVLSCDEHRAAAQKIADAAVTSAFDVKHLLPITGKVSFVQVEDESCRGDLNVFRHELEKNVAVLEGEPSPDRICVVAIFFKQRAFSGKIGMEEAAAGRIRDILNRIPATIIVSFGSPYVIREFLQAPAFVCTYSEDEFSQRAAARAMAGKIPFRGTIPIRLGD